MPFPLCLGRVDADTGGMSGDRRRDTKEPGRQQVCYLSQSEGEDLASRPCRMRGCPRHEGTQGLRSLWAKRTELLSVGVGLQAMGTDREVWNLPPRAAGLLMVSKVLGCGWGTGGAPSRCTCQLWLPKPSGGTASHLPWSQPQRRVVGAESHWLEIPGGKEHGGTA